MTIFAASSRKSLSSKLKNDTFIKSATILIVADIVVKVLGMLFKIPLANIIGEVGMGYFQTAYDLYLPFYSVAISGLPVLLSRLVAKSVSLRNESEMKASFCCCRTLFTAFGVIMTCLVLSCSLFISFFGGSPEAKTAIFVIAPCVLFSSLMGIFRGYFEGLNNMVPTAVSQIIEALGKAFFGVIGAAVLKSFGFSVGIQAAGACGGVLLGTVFGFLYLYIKLKIYGNPVNDGCKNNSLPDGYVKKIICLALPIIIGSLITQISGLVDVLTVQRGISEMIESDPEGILSVYPGLLDGLSGRGTEDIPAYLYGCFRGFATPIYALVPNLTAVIGVGLVPVVTGFWETGEREKLNVTLHSVIKFTSVVVLPAAAGIFALGPQILELIYSSKPFGAQIASQQLRILSLCAVFAGFSVPFTAVLQAVGKERIPVINMFIGVALKLILNVFLVRNTFFNVNGAAIGTTVCYLYIFVADLVGIVKVAGFVPDVINEFLKPAISAAVTGGAGYLCYKSLCNVFSSKLSTVIAILIAVLVYAVFVFCFKIILPKEIIKRSDRNG